MKEKIIMIIMAVALVALPAMAQQQEWQSTSAMQTSGSAYAPQVTAVGAAGVSGMATTTESYFPSQAPSGPRRTTGSNQNPGHTEDGSSPIGDAVLPLMLMAVAFCGIIYYRRKKALSR